jgi:hypothetical protein
MVQLPKVKGIEDLADYGQEEVEEVFSVVVVKILKLNCL